MKKSILAHSLALSALLVFSVTAFAQAHGRPAGVGAGLGGGLGAGAGLGAGNGIGAGMGANAGLGANANLGRANVGMNGGAGGNVNLARQSPGSVLTNTHLNTSLTAALDKSGVSIPGGNLQTACAGFKNLGECVAAMHVAQNLNIPFASLQSQMTGSGAVSLGKAIKSTAAEGTNAKKEAKRATKQAKSDLKAAQSASAAASASAHASGSAS
ncbi:MAG: hypothetical protein KGN79_10470 [Acidobacteriota bacterium]|nr:hypothetical protein [Acidobacteriota bacterium]